VQQASTNVVQQQQPMATIVVQQQAPSTTSVVQQQRSVRSVFVNVEDTSGPGPACK
jgi:hypothetical protein